MLNDQDSNMAANAICHSAAMIQESIRCLAEELMSPAVVFKPRLFRDGDQYCALLGDDLQSGVCGFGSSPADAMWDFNKSWNSKIEAKK